MKSGSQNEGELLEHATDFERVINASWKHCDLKNRLSFLLSMLFAMKSAFLLRKASGSSDDVGQTGTDVVGDAWEYVARTGIPELNTVHRSVQKLAAAVASDSHVAAISALREMGMFTLCPIVDRQLSSMEHLAENVTGRPRLVFLVELSLFAAELGNFEAVRRYVAEAWGLTPSSWELYNLCIFEGLFALEAGNLDEAVRLLEKSLSACQTDEITLIDCGLRPPNFLLAQRLLDRGLRKVVLKHLVECRTVWQRSWIPIETWVDRIENGEKPDFEDSAGLKGMRLPSCRLGLQWMRTRCLELATGDTLPERTAKSLDEVMRAKEKLLADVDCHISGKVTDAIKYLDKGLDDPPDDPPLNSSQHGQPK